MALTPKQKRFVEEYLIDLNATQAAIRAGYSEKSAYSIGNENMSKPVVAEAIETEMSKRAEIAEVSAQWVLDQAVRLYRRCMQDAVPLLDRNGNQIRDRDGKALYAFDSKGAVAALGMVGKHVNVQAFRDQVAHSGGVTLTVTQEDAEL